jgi:hypothetical protein
LIEPGTHQWNVQSVREIFMAPDADRILKIPLRNAAGEDWLAWSHEKSGIYSVRSAYHALVEAKEQEVELQVRTTSSSSDDARWKKLWNLDVLPRVRVFWWRVLNGIVPDYATLTRRHVRVNSTCPVCKATSETLMHALVECSHAQLFWTAARDAFNLKLPRLHPVTWAEDILCEPSFERLDRTLTISIMAAIWDSRNKWSHDDSGYSPVKAVDNIAETLAFIDGLKKKKSATTRPHFTWHGPPPGVIKVNSDGAIRSDAGIASTGGVARDTDGFKSAWCRLYQGITDPLIIEALALRDAVVAARSQGFDKIIAETDSAELVRLWMERGNHRAVIAPIISEISDISLEFSSFEILFARRSANVVAHECARYACAHGASAVWLNDSPEFLSTSLMADCNPGLLG